MKSTSIRFRLVAGGITLVLLPLIVIGIFSITKSSSALSDLSKTQAESIALDLAELADQLLKEEIKIAEVFAADEKVIDVVARVNKSGTAGATLEIGSLYESIGKQFSKLGACKIITWPIKLQWEGSSNSIRHENLHEQNVYFRVLRLLL